MPLSHALVGGGPGIPGPILLALGGGVRHAGQHRKGHVLSTWFGHPMWLHWQFRIPHIGVYGSTARERSMIIFVKKV